MNDVLLLEVARIIQYRRREGRRRVKQDHKKDKYVQSNDDGGTEDGTTAEEELIATCLRVAIVIALFWRVDLG